MTPHIAIDLGDGTAYLQRTGLGNATDPGLSDIERALLVLHGKLLEEREACAKLAENSCAIGIAGTAYYEDGPKGRDIAAAIRKRGEP